VAKFLEPNRKTNCSSLLKIIQTIFAGESNKVGIFFLVLKRKLGFLKRSCFSTMDAAIFTSVYVCNIPKTKKAFFNPNPPALSSSSCWLCNSQAKQIIKLRIREGSNQGLLRVHALFNNEEASSESEDKNGFGLLPADIFSLPQEKFGSNVSGEKDSENIIDVETSLAVPHGGGTRAGLFRTPISGGVQSATSAHGLPRPALAVRNLMEQARFAHLCTVMSKMHHRREGYPFGSLVDFAPDPMGRKSFP
jgi:hypothetical protein